MKKLLLVLVLLLAAGSAYAGQVVQVNFIGFNGGQWQNGYPYYANINGGQQINVMCDDWIHGGEPGQYWDDRAGWQRETPARTVSTEWGSGPCASA